mmetsp:Transcript_53148/g.116622  ORF Transcript_53148/g.116622 Transcript_53148/m.116622 type:complete len:194 (+) Transcript_53148:33-614(+)
MGNSCGAGLRAQIRQLEAQQSTLKREVDYARSHVDPTATQALEAENHRLRVALQRGRESMAAAATGSTRCRFPDEVIVIVDPSSASRSLVGDLGRQLWPVVGVRTAAGRGAPWSAQDNSAYLQLLDHVNNAQTLKALEQFRVVTVLPGSANGGEVAQQLRDALGLVPFVHGEDGSGMFDMQRRTTYDMLQRAG